MTEFLGSAAFRHLYILSMFILALLPLWKARALFAYRLSRRFTALRILLQNAPPALRLQSLLRFTSTHAELQSILASSSDPALVLKTLQLQLKKAADPLSNALKYVVSGIRRSRKNQLFSNGIVPCGPILHNRTAEQLLTFRFWGAFEAKLGLFGTFLGVSVGLVLMAENLEKVGEKSRQSEIVSTANQQSTDSKDEAVKLIQGVISSSATAFHTSVVGLAFALAFSLADRSCNRWISDITQPIADSADSFAPDWALSEEDSLDKSLEMLKEVTENLHAAAIQNERYVQQLLSGFVIELDSTFAKLRAQMSVAVQKSMDDRYFEHLQSVDYTATNMKELIKELQEKRISNSDTARPV